MVKTSWRLVKNVAPLYFCYPRVDTLHFKLPFSFFFLATPCMVLCFCWNIWGCEKPHGCLTCSELLTSKCAPYSLYSYFLCLTCSELLTSKCAPYPLYSFLLCRTCSELLTSKCAPYPLYSYLLCLTCSELLTSKCAPDPLYSYLLYSLILTLYEHHILHTPTYPFLSDMSLIFNNMLHR